MLIGAKMEDSANLKVVPSSEKKVEQLCKDLAGFAPYYLCGGRRMKHDNARNAFVWTFTRQLCRGSEEVPAAVKQVQAIRVCSGGGRRAEWVGVGMGMGHEAVLTAVSLHRWWREGWVLYVVAERL